MLNEEGLVASGSFSMSLVSMSMLLMMMAMTAFLPLGEEIFEDKDTAGDTAGDEVVAGSIDADHDDSTGNDADVNEDADGDEDDVYALVMNSKQSDDGGTAFSCSV